MRTRAPTSTGSSAKLRAAPLSRPAGEGKPHCCSNKRAGGEGATSALLSEKS
jgi:hypothetical protein